MLSTAQLKEIYRCSDTEQALEAIKDAYPKVVGNYTQILKASCDSSMAASYLWAALQLIISEKEKEAQAARATS